MEKQPKAKEDEMAAMDRSVWVQKKMRPGEVFTLAPREVPEPALPEDILSRLPAEKTALPYGEAPKVPASQPHLQAQVLADSKGRPVLMPA